jgi:hypothetical protein
MISVGFLVVGFALGYKVGFFYGFRCGRDDQAVLARIIEKERNPSSGGKGSQVRDPWD